MTAVKIEGVTRQFGGVAALAGVSLSVEPGERTALIGPNGAGKTTLLNVLHGQLSVTSGRIYLFGREITSTPTHARTALGMGRSYQINSLFGGLSVFDNTLLAVQAVRAERLNMWHPQLTHHEATTAAQVLLDEWGLREQDGELVQALSHGSQRRLEIALSLASEPKVLLLDEPTAGLTMEESRDITGRIDGLDPEMAVVFVAHDMDLVFSVARRIVVLHYGEVLADGTPAEVSANRVVQEIYMGHDEVDSQ